MTYFISFESSYPRIFKRGEKYFDPLFISQKCKSPFKFNMVTGTHWVDRSWVATWEFEKGVCTCLRFHVGTNSNASCSIDILLDKIHNIYGFSFSYKLIMIWDSTIYIHSGYIWSLEMWDILIRSTKFMSFRLTLRECNPLDIGKWYLLHINIPNRNGEFQRVWMFTNTFSYLFCLKKLYCYYLVNMVVACLHRLEIYGYNFHIETCVDT